MISFDVLPLPENESSEAAVTCDLLPLPEEKFTVHRIEWAGCNYCTWKCLKMGCTRMYPKMRKMDLGVSQVWVADIIAKQRAWGTASRSTLLDLLWCWRSGCWTATRLRCSTLLWCCRSTEATPIITTQMFPKSGEKIPVDSSSRTQKVARSSEASKFCTHPLLNTKSCQRKHASAWFVSELSLQCLKSVEQHGFWQNDLKHLEAQDSSGSFPWRSQDGRTTRPDPNSCTHTISRPGHDNLPYSACRICRQNLFWYHKAPGTCDWASSSSPQVTRCMSKYSSSLIPSKPHGAAPKARSRGSSRCRKGFSWFLYTWSYMISIYTVQSLQDSLEQIPNLWSHRGLMKALGLQLVNSWHGSRCLIWSWTVCGELWFQNTLRCHQPWLGNPQQDVHFPSFSSKPCLIPVGPP